MKVSANGIEIEVERHGNPDHPAALLIMGFTAQLTLWPAEFIQRLVDGGYQVIVFDNRDVGLSTKMEGQTPPRLAWHLPAKRLMPHKRFAGYDLTDMAADAIGVLDALGIEQAHVAGASMGGMIAQILAAKWPERVLSVMPVMTSTNAPGLPGPEPHVRCALIRTARGRSPERDAMIAGALDFLGAIGTKADGRSEAELREMIEASIDRSTYPQGAPRQMAAIIDSGNLRSHAASIAAPCLVLHGRDDPLIPPACGLDVARHIPRANFVAIGGMGHDLPPAYVEQIARIAVDHFDRAAG